MSVSNALSAQAKGENNTSANGARALRYRDHGLAVGGPEPLRRNRGFDQPSRQRTPACGAPHHTSTAVEARYALPARIFARVPEMAGAVRHRNRLRCGGSDRVGGHRACRSGSLLVPDRERCRDLETMSGIRQRLDLDQSNPGVPAHPETWAIDAQRNPQQVQADDQSSGHLSRAPIIISGGRRAARSRPASAS